MSEESFAYTPGLTVTPLTYVIRERVLPIKGDILVDQGEKVDFDTIVGRYFLEGPPYIVKVAELLGVEPEEVIRYLKVKIGDRVTKGTILAGYSALLGLIKKSVESPIEGAVESFNEITGHLTIRSPPRKIELKAYVRGRILKVVHGESVAIGTPAAFIQGIIGFGGEKHGVLEMVSSNNQDVVDLEHIREHHAGKVIVGGSLITYEALEKARKVGVAGVVVGGAKITDLERILGYRIGVAITGRENIGFTIVLTEGFGRLPMSRRAFEIFEENEGREAAINGATQVRAGVIRPEVIIPLDTEGSTSRPESLGEGKMKAGSIVRIIRYPYFGEIGVVTELPIELHKIETESPVRVVKVRLQSGREVVIPRANVEIISE
ncbi:MAG: hypothetical protein RMI56_04820 [Sulfolobales archaeon]|nr:hypothetical protein [Sulfolobales archaeon]MDW8083106.1 hypothetical protein [Sulfolobales archaeon]